MYSNNSHIKKSIIWTFMDSQEEIFSKIHKYNLWQNEESYSGFGSTIDSTQNIRKELLKIINEYNVKTILDAACGDFNWLKSVDLNLEKYIGVDIVPEMVEYNKINYSNQNREFNLLNIVNDKIPQVDMILCRECFDHLDYKNIFKALNNFKKSKSTYLLLTTYNIESNIDIDIIGMHRPLNFLAKPFSFPQPLSFLDDNNSKTQDKFIGLWQITDIPYF